jgi:hypothetical protein
MFIFADSGQGGYQFRDGGTYGDDGYADDSFRYAQLMGQSDTAIYHKAGTDKDGSGTAWRIHADEEPIQPFLLIQQCIQEIQNFLCTAFFAEPSFSGGTDRPLNIEDGHDLLFFFP